MADSKVTALTEKATPATTDLLYIVDDPAGTPVGKKAQIGNLPFEASGAIATHTSDTTSVHGIADTSVLLDSADIGASVQAYDAGLADIAALAVTDGNFIVGDGANWVAESGATARTSLGALPLDSGIVAVASGRDLLSTDAGKTLECDGTFTLTCPNGLDTGFQVAISNVGSGVITIAATTTLQSAGAAVTVATQYAMATVYHRGSNVWLLAGNIA